MVSLPASAQFHEEYIFFRRLAEEPVRYPSTTRFVRFHTNDKIVSVRGNGLDRKHLLNARVGYPLRRTPELGVSNHPPVKYEDGVLSQTSVVEGLQLLGHPITNFVRLHCLRVMSVIDVAVDESEKEQFGLGDARQCLRDWSGHCDKLQWWVKWLRQGS